MHKMYSVYILTANEYFYVISIYCLTSTNIYATNINATNIIKKKIKLKVSPIRDCLLQTSRELCTTCINFL